MELLTPLWANITMASLLWGFATWRRDVSLVDLLWPLLFVVAAWIWFLPAAADLNSWLALALIMLWGGRLHVHLARRNLGHGEDRRYRDLRESHAPGFWWKSYFIIFLLQAVLAWVASLAIYGALRYPAPAWIAVAGLTLALAGLVWEAVADWQLSRFKRDPQNSERVLNTGLWGLSRHPNYFGECCFWWGVFLLALPAAWWAVISPLLITFLLLRVSGVTLLEKDIGQRRPGYDHYVESVPAFFPAFSRIFTGGSQ